MSQGKPRQSKELKENMERNELIKDFINKLKYELTDSGQVEDNIDKVGLDKDKAYKFLKEQEKFIDELTEKYLNNDWN